jgi:hypothetical protein
MLWRPMTAGEDAFLCIYRAIGRHIEFTMPQPLTLDFLVCETSFREFMRLVATLELFLRSLRGSISLYRVIGHLPPLDFGKRLHREEDLPRTLYDDRKFCELMKRAAQISTQQRPCPRSIAKDVRDASNNCYMCDVLLTRKSGDRNEATLDHLWPLSLGGESNEGNLIAACRDCNEKRKNSVTWAWGPVQSTYYQHLPTISPNVDLRFSLAMARLMTEASGQRTGDGLATLKAAAVRISPLFPAIKITDDRHRVYFELFRHVMVAA